MSGPITRQYGVPNWDEIFGKKEDSEANPKVKRTNEDDKASQESEEENADKPKE